MIGYRCSSYLIIEEIPKRISKIEIENHILSTLIGQKLSVYLRGVHFHKIRIFTNTLALAIL